MCKQYRVIVAYFIDTSLYVSLRTAIFQYNDVSLIALLMLGGVEYHIDSLSSMTGISTVVNYFT